MSEIEIKTDYLNYYYYFAYICVFFIIIWGLKTYFVPYYKTNLKENIRKWIFASHLDSSGTQIQNDRTSNSTNEWLKGIEMMEQLLDL